MGCRHALGRATRDPKHDGFQLYTTAHEITTGPIPDELPYEKVVVLPLAISTAAAGLYQNDFLALPYPTVGAKPLGKKILIWGRGVVRWQHGDTTSRRLGIGGHIDQFKQDTVNHRSDVWGGSVEN